MRHRMPDAWGMFRCGDLRSIEGPADVALPKYEIQIVNGMVQVAIDWADALQTD